MTDHFEGYAGTTVPTGCERVATALAYSVTLGLSGVVERVYEGNYSAIEDQRSCCKQLSDITLGGISICLSVLALAELVLRVVQSLFFLMLLIVTCCFQSLTPDSFMALVAAPVIFTALEIIGGVCDASQMIQGNQIAHTTAAQWSHNISIINENKFI